MSKEITTEMLLDMIEKIGWDIGGYSNVARLDTVAHNMELQQKVKVLEKALELACGQIWAMSIWENTKEEVIRDNIEYFKTKAKEMMKSE